MLPVQHHQAVECATTVILCVDLDIEIQSICPKESPLPDYVHKAVHWIIFVLNTTVVNKNINFRYFMFLTILLIIVPLSVDPKKEARGNVVHHLLYFKLITSINWKDIIRSIINTQAINIERWQVIGRYGLFTFEARQKDILAHVHGQCNILYSGAWMLCLCMDYLILASLIKIICLYYLKMWWKDASLCFCVLCILHLQFDISDEIGIVSSSIIIILPIS